MNTAFFSSARMILLECHESPALDKLLIHTINNSPHNITIHEVKAHTNILGNDEANKLAKQRS